MTLSTWEKVKTAVALIVLLIMCLISLPTTIYEGRPTPLYLPLLAFLLFLTGLFILFIVAWAVESIKGRRRNLKP